MELEKLEGLFTVCKLDLAAAPPLERYCFAARTDEELSLVCPSAVAPADTLAREDGWRGFRVVGKLDFALVGILARISGALAEEGISLFAVSTYDTDYIFLKAESFDAALAALQRRGFHLR